MHFELTESEIIEVIENINDQITDFFDEFSSYAYENGLYFSYKSCGWFGEIFFGDNSILNTENDWREYVQETDENLSLKQSLVNWFQEYRNQIAKIELK